ncbi:MAG TPA: hypothetical protein VES20_19830, partial [Bryobacteraceae bacterium]|nr:hypothetical protein [Bryobacteraceae bacterium]
MTHIAQHEWRLVRRDGTAMLVLSGLVLLSILGAWNGARWSSGLERAKANVQADEARRLHSLGGQMDRAWRGAAFP